VKREVYAEFVSSNATPEFTPEPAMESEADGEVDPIPTFPPVNIAAAPAPAWDTASVGYALDEEAKMPAWPQNGEVVAEVVMPKVAGCEKASYEASLLLKVDQSAAVRKPLVEAEAAWPLV
jgi:hypothetical protein